MATPEEIYKSAQAALHEIYQAALETGDSGMIQQTLSSLISGTFGEDKKTPLHFAARKGRAEAVRMLLKAGADPNAKDECGCTPLYHAFFGGGLPRLDIVKNLLEEGADPNAQSNNGVAPFHLAVQYSTVEIVKVLLENGADLGARDKDGRTALHWAAATENGATVVQFLIENGAVSYLNATTTGSQTPLHFACERGNSDAVRCFLAYDAVDLEAKDSEKRTPLRIAALEGHLSIVELMADNGANLEAKDEDGFTPLHCACFYNRFVVVKGLVERGASIYSKNKQEYTPLDNAIRHNNTDIINYLLQRYRETVSQQEGSLCLHSVLHRAKYVDVDVDDEDENVEAVLPVGALAMDQMATPGQVLCFLVDGYPNSVRSRDSKRATPLHVACRSRHASMEVLRFLVQKDKAVLFQIDASGCIPLHAACTSAGTRTLRLKKIKFLVETGGAGTLTARDDENWALPLHVLCASKPGVKEVEYLVQQYPEALYKKTKLGDVPIMVACEHSASLSSVYALMRAHPGALIDK